MIHFYGLKKRVIKNFFIIIIITILLFESMFILYIRNYYYDYVKQTLNNQAYYTKLIYNTSSNVDNASFETKIKNIMDKQAVDEKSKNFAIQIIDKDRRLILDQYGFKSNKILEYEDVKKALDGDNNLTPYMYKTEETKEHVMSISVPIKANNKIQGAVRYTLSLSQIDGVIFKVSTWVLFAGIVILLIAISLSIRFANTIIKPIVELKLFANELAHGNFSIKLNDIETEDDEIRDLANTFVYMASEIDKSDKLKEEFISSISHELRTPLTSIKGWSETLSYDEITKEELDLGLNIIQDETERLIKLVEELLDFSRLSSDRIKLKIENVDIKYLVKSVINQLIVKSRKKSISLDAYFEDENLIQIQGDKDRLRQVLINLIQNSLKFTNENGYIKLFISQDEEFTFIKVVDNGEGIEKENLKKVLDKFFQEDYNKAGSGLGLAISNEIIKLHGGSMDIKSEKGVGTEMLFKIKNKHIESI